jgi:hypothetical protein
LPEFILRSSFASEGRIVAQPGPPQPNQPALKFRQAVDYSLCPAHADRKAFSGEWLSLRSMFVLGTLVYTTLQPEAPQLSVSVDLDNPEQQNNLN